jgi:hypothetical protein
MTKRDFEAIARLTLRLFHPRESRMMKEGTKNIYNLEALIAEWADFAERYHMHHAQSIGEDFKLGNAWTSIGGNLVTLCEYTGADHLADKVRVKAWSLYYSGDDE